MIKILIDRLNNNEVDDILNRLWYLLPIFLGIIGGAIGYFVVRDKDPVMAKRMLILGIIVSAIGLIIGFSTTPDIQLPTTNTNN